MHNTINEFDFHKLRFQATFLLPTFITFAKHWKVIVKHCVESLRQAHEVWTACTLFVQPITFVMIDSTYESLHFLVRILLS